MKKLSIILLLCVLLCGCATTESPTNSIRRSPKSTEATTVETIPELPETEPPTTEPPHWAYYDPEISVEEALTWFNEVCLDAEIVNGGDATLIQKWDVPIYYYINGDPTDEDLAALQEFTQWINTVEGFPGMFPARDLGQANLHIYFCTQQELLNIMGPNFDGMDGAVTYWYEDNAIYNANICIRTDIPQNLRNSVILEEIYNGLGPIQDTTLRPDSIIWAEYAEPQCLTAVDELILRLLYHPEMDPGMDAARCEAAIRELYK